MTDMGDLVTWLRAQLDDDERVIRIWEACCFHIEACDETGGYLERFDEARMLAEVEAKRRILDQCADTMNPYDDGHWLAKLVIQRLAQPYAGRPGWREEWAA